MARGSQRPKPEYPIALPEIDGLPWLGMRAISRLSGFPISTLQMQFQREIYPWLEIGQQGRARRFDPAFALHLCIAGALAIGFSIPAANASAIALDILHRRPADWRKPLPRRKRVDLTEPDLKAVIGPGPEPRSIWVIRAKTFADIESELGDETPSHVIVLDLSAMVTRLREAAVAADEDTER
jgi:hypothetical protein